MTDTITRETNKFRLIFKEEELNRISFEGENGDEIIVVDVHGMKCSAAHRFVHNIITVIHAAFKLLVIHGYNNGTAIRDMLRSGLKETKVVSVTPDIDNDGRTMIICAA